MLDHSCYVGQFPNGFQESLKLNLSSWNKLFQLFGNDVSNDSEPTTVNLSTSFGNQSPPWPSTNLTSVLITSFTSLFDLNVDLTFLRMFLCLRSELISLIFFVLFILNQLTFSCLIPLCSAVWRRIGSCLSNPVSLTSAKCDQTKPNHRQYYPSTCQVFAKHSVSDLKSKPNNDILDIRKNVCRKTRFVYYKKVVIMCLMLLNLAELLIRCVVQFRPLFIESNSSPGQLSTLSLFPLLSSTIRLSTLLYVTWYHFKESCKSQPNWQILVALFGLISLLNSSFTLSLFYFDLTIDVESSLSIYQICNFCSWDTFPRLRSLYNPNRGHHTSIFSLFDNFNYYNFDLCFSCLYFVTFLVQFVLTFYAEYTEDESISDCDSDSCTIIRRPSSSSSLKSKKNPENYDTLFGRLMFCWISSTIYRGYRRPLAKEDIFVPSLPNRTETLVQQFQQWIEKHYEKTRQSSSDICVLYSMLFKLFGSKLIKIAGIKLVPTLLTFFTPILLSRLIQFMKSGNEQPTWHGFLYIGLLFLLSCTETFLNSHADYLTSILALQTRSCLMAAIYRRLLLSKAWSWLNGRRYTSGEIITMMSVDVQSVLEYAKFINLIWICPVQLSICAWMLHHQISYGSLATFAVLAVIFPFNWFLGTRMKSLQSQVLKCKDQRIKLLNETLAGIRAVKMYAWEERFIERIDQCRRQEVAYLKLQAWYSAAVTFIFNSATFFTAFASFGTYLLISSDNQLNAQKVFVSLTIFQIIRKPLAFFPQFISSSMTVYVSTKRISQFLQLSKYCKGNILISNDTRESSDKNICNTLTQIRDPQKATILVKNCSYIWPQRSFDSFSTNNVSSPRSSFQSFILHNVDLQIEQPKLCAIVGENGAGKSSLLLALLDQMPKIPEPSNGQCMVRGKISYVPQYAWIQNGTVRENILFGACFDSKRYRKVVSACALSEDFKQLSNGDQAIVGEKGFSLSGGQKQRISIARAIYIDADIYLFDNPLSALDSQIARHVFDRVIGPNGILSRKIRLLVTQNMAILPHIDEILLLKNGSIVSRGVYESLMKHQNEFTDFLTSYLSFTPSSANNELNEDKDGNKLCPVELVVEPDEYEVLEEMAGRLERQFSSFSSRGSVRRKISRRSSLISIKTNKPKSSVTEPKKTQNNNNEESAKTGSVSWKVYLNYIKVLGLPYSLLIVLIFLTGHLFVVMNYLWLSSWSSDIKSANPNLNQTTTQIDWFISSIMGSDVDIHNRWVRLAVYAFLGTVQTFFVLFGTLQISLRCLAVSKYLDSKMLTRILSAPVWIFDVISGGQILNRFSKDVNVADSNLINSLRLLLLELFRTLASLFIIGIGTNPIIIVCFTPLVVIYFCFYKFYISTSRQLIRIESALRTPIYTLFSETFAGVSVIQALGVTRRFMDRCYSQIDANSSATHMSISASRWLSIRLELLGNLVVLITGLFCVSLRGSIMPGMAALCITCALTITNTLNLLIRSCTEMVSNFVSIERLFEYIRLPQEASWHSNHMHNRTKTSLSDSLLPYSDQCSLIHIVLQKCHELWQSFWPRSNKTPVSANLKHKALICPARTSHTWLHSGSIAVCNYSARYRSDLELCLRNINLFINQGFKVGIVGRTGAGKSSFALSLFRLIESESGCILIGGRQIKALGLHELRSALTIIPQDPLLFTGTLRENLDPLNEYTDEQIILSLDKAHLGEMIRNGSLDQSIDEAQIQSISLGQKQLLCLARALLHRTKILILDEATAAIDPATDELVQNTIETEFSQCTILAIVHRLSTVLNYDRILVLDNGQVAEFDLPANLLANHNSLFYKMLRNGL